MALELSGFVAPVDKYEGLYKIGDDLKDQTNKKDLAAKAADTKRATTTKAVSDFADPLQNLSGTPTDPEYIRKMSDIKTDGIFYASQGMDFNEIQMMLHKKVDDLNAYQAAAKNLNTTLTSQLGDIPVNAGYDKLKIIDAARKKAWYNPDGSVKSSAFVDPTQNYVGQAIQDHPEDLTTNEGIDNWMKNQKLQTSKGSFSVKNAKGGSETQKMDLSSYEWQVPNINEAGVSDKTFVPKYEVAHDGQEPIMHTFVDAQGNKTSAPVRLLAPDTYHSLLSNSPGTADWLRGQINLGIKSGNYKDAQGNPIKPNSPQAEQLGRAIAYDELKVRGGGSMSETVEQKAAPIKNTTIINNGKVTPEINDMYGRISQKVEETIKTSGRDSALLMNRLDSDESDALLAAANKVYKNTSGEQLGVDNTYIFKEDDGKLAMYKTNDAGQKQPILQYRIMTIPKVGTNLKVQPGVKEKRAVIANESKKDPLGLF